MNKICPKCHEAKAIDLFGKRRNGRTATAYHIMAEGRKINTFCTARAAIKFVNV